MKSLLKKLLKLAENRDSFVIVIDGMSASGKTTLAFYLGKELDANVISTDAFFLPRELRTRERLLEVGGNMHYERFKKEVIDALKGDITYKNFNCSIMDYDKTIYLPKKRFTIIEGSYALHPFFGKYYDYAIFLKISEEKQVERIKLRNPYQVEAFLEKWIPLENEYFKKYQISLKCDEIRDNS